MDEALKPSAPGRSAVPRRLTFGAPRVVPRAAPFAALLAALLGACAGPAPRPPADTPPRAAPAAPPAQTADKPADAATRPGGYYLDDGPGDSPPPDIESIPDAQPKIEPLHRFANNPYSVFGEDYVPDRKIGPYTQRGVASWYGKRFHGRPTASGERYDMYAMSAAHRTLPIPSYARITNVANGKSVLVRVNDRGPFHAKRLVDLSYAAAQKLGYVSKGSTLVEVHTLQPDEIRMAEKNAKIKRTKYADGGTTRADEGAKLASAAPTPSLLSAAVRSSSRVAGSEDDPLAEFLAAEQPQATPAPLPTSLDLRGIFLQLGAFTSRANAESFRDHVRSELAWLTEPLQVQPKDGRFRLQLGPYRSAQDAKRVADRIRDALSVKPLLVER